MSNDDCIKKYAPLKYFHLARGVYTINNTQTNNILRSLKTRGAVFMSINCKHYLNVNCDRDSFLPLTIIQYEFLSQWKVYAMKC